MSATSAQSSAAQPQHTPSGPRYFQVKMAVKERITSLGPGASLPPERKLAAELGTSRTTLRKALAELSAEGVLSSTQGSGNFIEAPKPVLMRQLTSFSDDLQAMGMSVESRVLAAANAPADAETASHLAIDIGAPVLILTRLRIVGGEPLALETAHLPGDLTGLADRVDANGSLYATLRDEFGIAIRDVEDCVQTALAAPEQAGHLNVPISAPLLLIDRCSRDAAGRIVEWTRSHYRGDRVRFIARGKL